MNSLSTGVELGYMSALSIPIYLEYERMLQKNVGIYGQMLYDLNARQFGISAGVHLQLEW
jgi:nucleoside 2-deoxyribosyltransferase